MPAQSIPDHKVIQGVRVPTFLYGTAWKEHETARLTLMALEAGFRGLDTANQRKHYHEAGVGQALRQAFKRDLVRRDELFLQTKFTYARGQDHRLPYDPNKRPTEQVQQSIASSLEHLHVDYLDSYVLHGPENSRGISPVDLEVWRTMQSLQRAGTIRLLGISNVTAEQLDALCDAVEILPAFVQNRCYARLGWDFAIREVCRKRGVQYQGFSLLTANRTEINSPEMFMLIDRYNKTAAQVVFRFAAHLDMIRLTGTTNRTHMRDDLDSDSFSLSAGDVAWIENIAANTLG